MGSHSHRVLSSTVDCTLQFGESLTSGSEFYSRLYSPIWGIAHIRLRVLQSTVLSHSGSYSQQVQSSTVDCNLPFGESITSGSRVLQWTVLSHPGSQSHQAQEFYSGLYSSIRGVNHIRLKSSTVDCNLSFGESPTSGSKFYSGL